MSGPWTPEELRAAKLNIQPRTRSFDEFDLARWALLGRTPLQALPYVNGRPEPQVVDATPMRGQP